MFLYQTVVAILALSTASVSAAPHGLRARCKHTAKPSTVSASATALPVSESTKVASAIASSSAVTSSIASTSASSTASASPSTSPAAAPHSFALSALSALLPVSQSNFWSTADAAPDALPLSDNTLRPQKEIKELAHPTINFAGKQAMKAHYPKGSYTFGHQPRGGISFYAPGPSDIDLTTAKEATFGYSVYFPDGFDFVKGGKLPGLYGGDDADGSISCSGGRQDDACFSARLMWRTDGAGELYTYLPPSKKANDAVCSVAPESHCNPEYGASVGRGAFTWKTGQWNTISQRVRLNDPGQENGELELFYEGRSVTKVGGLVLRTKDIARIRGMQVQTFFGGSDSSWATPKDQDVYFADFTVAITEKL